MNEAMNQVGLILLFTVGLPSIIFIIIFAIKNYPSYSRRADRENELAKEGIDFDKYEYTLDTYLNVKAYVKNIMAWSCYDTEWVKRQDLARFQENAIYAKQLNQEPIDYKQYTIDLIIILPKSHQLEVVAKFLEKL